MWDRLENLRIRIAKFLKDGRTALMLAVLGGNPAIIKLLLAVNADVNQQDKDGQTALMLAVLRGNPAIVKLLLAVNADTRQQDKQGRTALMLAAENGHTEIVELLLATNADSNQRDEDSQTVLNADANQRNEDGQTILNADSNQRDEDGQTVLNADSNQRNEDGQTALNADINQRDEDGKTALMLAAENGHTEIVELLLAVNADICQQDKQGRTALMLAAANGHTKTVELLLAANVGGAYHRDKNGQTALMLAAANGYTEIVELILLKARYTVSYQDLKYQNALLLAVENGHIKTVEVLLKAKAKINSRNENGQTALLLAAAKGHLQMVKILLDYRPEIQINLQDKDGDTALMKAVEIGSLELIKLLLNNKADPNIQNNNRKNPLMMACLIQDESCCLEVVKLLLPSTLEITINLQNNDENTALLHAVRRSYLELVELLLDKKADPNTQDSSKMSALIIACSTVVNKNCYLKMVELLLNAKADPNLTDCYGHTALIYADNRNDIRMLKLLLDAKADPSIINRFGFTVLSSAAGNESLNLELIKFLIKNMLVWDLKIDLINELRYCPEIYRPTLLLYGSECKKELDKTVINNRTMTLHELLTTQDYNSIVKIKKDNLWYDFSYFPIYQKEIKKCTKIVNELINLNYVKRLEIIVDIQGQPTYILPELKELIIKELDPKGIGKLLLASKNETAENDSSEIGFSKNDAPHALIQTISANRPDEQNSSTSPKPDLQKECIIVEIEKGANCR